jgi:hypothetical protein
MHKLLYLHGGCEYKGAEISIQIALTFAILPQKEPQGEHGMSVQYAH